MDESARILKYLDLAEKSGKKFAFKNGKYEPECMAEARYILTYTILVENKLLNNAEDEEVFLKIVIARRLRNYFNHKYNSEKVGVPIKESAQPHDDIGLIDELESLFPGHNDVFSLWRDGFDLGDILFLNRHTRMIRRDLMKVKQKLKRSRTAREAKLNALNYQPDGQLFGDQTRKSA